MTYLLQFGSYQFPSGFVPMSQESPRDLAEQERPRGSGSITQAGRVQSRRLSVEGSAMGFGGGPTAIQAAEDAIRGACEGSGAVQPLYFGRSDRYINAQLAGLTDSYAGSGSSLFGVAHKLLLSFVAGDPYFYDSGGPLMAVGLTSGGGTVTPGGNAPAYAAWTITVSADGTGQIVLTNTTSGQSATIGTALSAWSAGDVILLTRTATVYTVAKNSVLVPGLLMGLIPTLQTGANVLTLSAPTLTLGALGCTYTSRWQS